MNDHTHTIRPVPMFWAALTWAVLWLAFVAVSGGAVFETLKILL